MKVKPEGLRGAANICSRGGRHPLTAMFGADETSFGGGYAVYCLFENKEKHDIDILKAEFDAGSDLHYPALTPVLPAAAWYERELHDMFGFIPDDHPDLRPLVLHETYPEDFHPLRKCVDIDADVRGERKYEMAVSHGDGLFEVPVGPIHAGIIEPGHFRFSQAGEAILQLDAKLFFTHRGIEKAVEGKTPEEALLIVERICGACSVANTLSYCQALEKLSGQNVPRRAWLIRTIAAELERLYNHIGDTGNMCAGVGFAPVISMGSRLKEILLRCNEAIAGNRFLRGLIVPGGVKYDLTESLCTELTVALTKVENEYNDIVQIIAEQDGFLNRAKTTGIISKNVALDLALVGVGARASGVDCDCRRDLPYGLYAELPFNIITKTDGDVYARLQVRMGEVAESITLIRKALKLLQQDDSQLHCGELAYKTLTGSWGISESARGSNLHWLMLDADGCIERLFIRSASYPNWPALTIAVQGDIIPDFPLINKSFELCYACLDR